MMLLLLLLPLLLLLLLLLLDASLMRFALLLRPILLVGA